MKIESPQKDLIGIALNEAKLLGLEFDSSARAINCTFSVLSLDEEYNAPLDNRVIVLLKPIGRISVSLRKGAWDAYTDDPIHFELEQLLQVVQSFGGQPIYGWDFINTDSDDYEKWKNLLSCSYESSEPNGFTNTIILFQEYYEERHLDIKIWFDDLIILDPSFKKIELSQFISNGERVWNAIAQNKPEGTQFAIISASEKNNELIKGAIETEFNTKAKNGGQKLTVRAVDTIKRIFNSRF